MDDSGFLAGVRVLEIGTELGEYCGKVLAGLGADVIRIEPPGGELTRTYGPFYHDTAGPENSLYFWHYNFGKRSVVLDLDSEDGRADFRRLAATAAVLLDSRPRDYLSDRGLGYESLAATNPGLIHGRISPFGDTGPWRDYQGSDLVHLALGGVMMNCGYDPDPTGFYDTPPIAPQMWQSYQIAGEMMAIGIIGALYYRYETGLGQQLSVSVHQAVAQQTETDLPNWVLLRQTHYRKTARHSTPADSPPVLARTKDGRWMMPYRTYLGGDTTDFRQTAAVLDRYAMADDLLSPTYAEDASMNSFAADVHLGDVIGRFVERFHFDREIWREFQEAGLTWAPIRRPEENVTDAHWQARQTFLSVERPELGRSFNEVGAKWMCPEVPWRTGPRSPLVGEHNNEIFATISSTEPRPVAATEAKPRGTSRPGKPMSLDGVRMIDLGWLLASAGAGRFLAAQGAEVIKVEHKSRWDMMRWAPCVASGSRAERDAATGPLPTIVPDSPNRAGFFMEINAGKRAISLNLKHPRGKELLAKLIAGANVVGEGFSPGTMDRMGFGYQRLQEIRPGIVYVQQSGMGQLGEYGRMRSYGPVAQAFSGLTDMSGLPEPYPPAGIGYSFLDWFGAYNMATAIMAGLYRQRVTGKGCWIDSSQVESGTFLTGTAVLDHSANGRRWSRYGNASPYKHAAPHGAYRAAGEDRWVAISCFTDPQWTEVARVLGLDATAAAFATLQARIDNAEALDRAMNEATQKWDPFDLMHTLQAAGVPAGVCQTAQDRYESDPQLRSMGWLVELPQSTMGTWPCKEIPVHFSRTPTYIGGTVGRHGPDYGEDNEYVFGEILGMSSAEIRSLAEDGVL